MENNSRLYEAHAPNFWQGMETQAKYEVELHSMAAIDPDERLKVMLRGDGGFALSVFKPALGATIYRDDQAGQAVLTFHDNREKEIPTILPQTFQFVVEGGVLLLESPEGGYLDAEAAGREMVRRFVGWLESGAPSRGL